MASRRAARSAAEITIRISSSTVTFCVASLPPALILMVYSPGSTSGPRGPNPNPAAMASSCSGVGSAGGFPRKSQLVRFTPAAPGPSNSRITLPSLSRTVILAFFLRRRLVLRFVFRGVFLVLIVFVFFRRFRRYSFLQVVAQKRAVGGIFGGEHFLPRAPAAVPYEPSCRRARREERQW